MEVLVPGYIIGENPIVNLHSAATELQNKWKISDRGLHEFLRRV